MPGNLGLADLGLADLGPRGSGRPRPDLSVPGYPGVSPVQFVNLRQPTKAGETTYTVAAPGPTVSDLTLR